MKLWSFVTHGWQGIPCGTYYRTRKQALTDPCARSPHFELVSFEVKRVRKKSGRKVA